MPFIDKNFLMENTIILIAVIILVVAGWILYLYRDAIKAKYNSTSGKVKADVSHAVKDIKEDIKN